tara:strand:- start:1330 stop:2514 length:1185 start_codon:yes stop_codon:yes gene_type:complete
MIRVAFLINFNYLKWLGGTYVIKNLIDCINSYSKGEIEPILIVKKDLSKKEIKEFKNIKLLKTNFFHNQSLVSKIYNKFLVFCLGKSSKYENFFKKNNINVLSHSNALSNSLFLGKNSSIKSLPFIADLQYLHFPENFSFKNILFRKLSIVMCALHSSKIILSSLDVKKDLKKISKLGHKKSIVHPFIFKSPSKNKILSLSFLKRKYKISTNFFYLPNQYRIHKNHIIVLEALKHLKKDNKLNNLLIISTGHSEDNRKVNYFKEIKNFISENSLENNYRYLGIVPFIEVESFIYHSVALIHPSKFEGRSSPVEQAKAIGKQVILSNIDIHKEQKPRRGLYFNPNNFLKLSSIMLKTWNNYNSSKERRFINIAYKQNIQDLHKYYIDYLKIVKNV